MKKVNKAYRLATVICLTVASFSLVAQEVYRCEDENGIITYSNALQEGVCHLVTATFKPTFEVSIESERFEAPTASGGSTGRRNTSSTTKTSSSRSNGDNQSTASSTTRISPITQHSRDQKRRAILEEELDIEQKNLIQAKARLAHIQAQSKNTPTSSQLNQVRQQVTQHEKNIDAIKRELARMPKT